MREMQTCTLASRSLAKLIYSCMHLKSQKISRTATFFSLSSNSNQKNFYYSFRTKKIKFSPFPKNIFVENMPVPYIQIHIQKVKRKNPHKVFFIQNKKWKYFPRWGLYDISILFFWEN